MFNNQIPEANTNHIAHNDDYNWYNIDTGHRFIVNWSPQEENKYFSQHKFASPRVLSKSVPRRTRSLMRYKINRSLNFDNVHNKNETTFKSPSSSAEKSYFEGGSRSAKIMKALNFGNSPLYNQTRKIKKSLNFDLSPKPKRFTSSPQAASKISLITPSPRLSRSLRYDSSPTDTNSTPSSVLLTSSESIDENQNQTPSQRSRHAKKSLNYLTPALEQNVQSSDRFIMSPLLRSGLKEKIDDIVQINGTPNLHSLRKSSKNMRNRNDVTASTPRNLFHDFCDEDNERPCTPENTIRIIPESMSAIKKSHKKDRLSRRLEHDISDATSDPFTTELTDILQVEKRPSTPPLTEKNRSPTYDVNSIKQSHKKDKTKRKVTVPHSEDEISDTGSIFEYCTDREEGAEKNVSVESDKSGDAISLKDSSYGSEENSNYCASTDGSGKQKGEELQSEPERGNKSEEMIVKLPETPASHRKSEPCIENLNANEMSIVPADNENRPMTPEIRVTSPQRTQRTNTPENHVNYLQRIMTESIKKSHRKVKDDNKKKLFRPKNLQQKLDSYQPGIVNGIDQDCPFDCIVDDCRPMDDSLNSTSDNVNRAGTPENVNSSRLLLSQFSSVKKSHRKDKHNKIVSGFNKRQRYLSKHGKPLATMEHKSHDSSMSSCENDQKDSDMSMKDIQVLDTKEGDLLNKTSNMADTKSGLYQETPSPSKRKKATDNSIWSATSKVLDVRTVASGEYESAEEEFKIFTPIKKRKPLPIHPGKEQFNNVDSSDDESMNVASSRCLTPVISYHECLNSSDSDFQPIKNCGSDAENYENCTSRQDESNNLSDSNGRQTPQNRSTAELLVHLNSIKKSHKKDKRGCDLRRQLAMNQEAWSNDKENEDFSGLPMLLVPSAHSSPNIETRKSKRLQQTMLVDYDNPQPSTSKANLESENVGVAEKRCTDTLNTTPPNCLRVMSYIKLLQTESIKRSHKKVRVQKKYSVMMDNSQLSDDGSIFGDEEVVASFEESKLMLSTSNMEDEGDQVHNQSNNPIDNTDASATALNASSCDEGQQTKSQGSGSPNNSFSEDS